MNNYGVKPSKKNDMHGSMKEPQVQKSWAKMWILCRAAVRILTLIQYIF